MKISNGKIIFQTVDIICLSVSAGSGVAWIVKTYQNHKQRRGTDPLVTELKQVSRIRMVSRNEKPLNVPTVRGGAEPRGYSLVLKNKKLARLLMALLSTKKKAAAHKVNKNVFIPNKFFIN